MKKKRIMITIVSAILLLSIVTFAYYTTGVSNDDAQTVELSTGTMSLTFADNDMGFGGQINFGQVITKKFTIENTGELATTASIYWDNLTNTYLSESLTYRLEYSTTEDGTYEVLEIGENVPRSETSTRELLSDAISLLPGEKQYFTLKITFENLPDINQDADKTAHLFTQFDIESTNYDSLKRVVTGGQSPIGTPFLGGQTGRDKYEAIYTVDHINIPATATYSWDVSQNENGSVMAWDMDEDNDGMYELYIGQEGGVVANVDSVNLFVAFTNITDINLENLNTSKTRNMKQMFAYCLSLNKITIPESFDTSKVTNMRMMFGTPTAYTMNLTEIENLNLLNTSKVVNMDAMFQNNSGLEYLDLSSFDTSNVENMSNMFSHCTKLSNLDLQNFNTQNVINIIGMFAYISNLEVLNIKNMTFNNVNEYQEMFKSSSVNKIIIEDQVAQTFISSRLSEAGINAEIVAE